MKGGPTSTEADRAVYTLLPNFTIFKLQEEQEAACFLCSGMEVKTSARGSAGVDDTVQHFNKGQNTLGISRAG